MTWPRLAVILIVGVLVDGCASAFHAKDTAPYGIFYNATSQEIKLELFVGATALPLVFRSTVWLRAVCVVVLLLGGLSTCSVIENGARHATEVRASKGTWNTDFRDGILEMRHAMRQYYPTVVLITLGLSLLALVPFVRKSHDDI